MPWLRTLLFFTTLVAIAKKAARPFRMLDPVHVGHSRVVKLSGGADGRKVQMETLAMEPPLFYIKNILSDTEADEVVAAARSQNSWHASSLDDNDRVQLYKQFLGSLESWSTVFSHFDRDGDLSWSTEEVRSVALEAFQIGRHNHTEFLSHHGLPPNTTEVAQHVTFEKNGFLSYFVKVTREHPERADRYGSQTWIEYSDRNFVADRLKDYMRSITKGSKALFIDTQVEPLQVAHYPGGGHFSCHPDATEFSPRMATMIYFLNTPLEGGELVFPGAGVSDFEITDQESFRLNCSDYGGCLRMGGVVVRPRKGDAVLWYNMRLNLLKRPGRYNQSDLIIPKAIHCGADVLSGEKYIATVWVHLPPGYTFNEDRDKDRRSEL